MAAIDFPTSPSNGQTLTVGDVTYTYNSTKARWEITSSNVTVGVTTGKAVAMAIVFG
jgi:hypothetical protein